MSESKAVDVKLNIELYSPTAIKKAAYRLADRCTIELKELDGSEIAATLRFRPGTSDAAVDDVVRLFFQELLDEELREKLRAETDAIRSLILAHAFSKTDLIKRS